MNVLVCSVNGRVLPYMGVVYDGYLLVEVADSDGGQAIKEGLIYKEGSFFTPPVDVDELKAEALTQLYKEFVSRRDAVRWVKCSDGNTYGFDCLAEDRSNFMQAYTPLLVDKAGTTLYKVWLTETTKGVVHLTYEDMKTTYETVRDSQFGDYAWFEELRTKIRNCTTVEELEAVV